MTRITSISILFLFFISTAFTQIQVKEDFPINAMMKQYAETNKSTEKLDGWRIQIIARTDRNDIEQAKNEFINDFPGVSVDWTHSKPYYRLRAGAFLTKIDAIRMIQRVSKKYPGAFPVKDSIKKIELLPSI